MSYLQAIVIGLLQGISELFPVSSLGHSVLLPAWLGWHGGVFNESGTSPYLAFVVGLHLATAGGLVVCFWRDWLRILSGMVRTVRERRLTDTDGRLGWLLVVGTIPVGLVGVALQHQFSKLFAKPEAAAMFLTANGFMLMAAERLRNRASSRSALDGPDPNTDDDRRPSDRLAKWAQGHGAADPAAVPAADGNHGSVDELARSRKRLGTLAFTEAGAVGSAQILALCAGISRSGASMTAGLLRGLDHEDAARFSFLLATPVIMAAGVLKVPDLTGKLGDGLHGQILAGSICALVAAVVATKFLLRYFKTRTLWPFAIYCLAAGAVSAIRFA